MVNLSILMLLSCAQAALMSNYKLYDSWGKMLYDYTGNGSHADLWWTNGTINRPLITDRGQYYGTDFILSCLAIAIRTIQEALEVFRYCGVQV